MRNQDNSAAYVGEANVTHRTPLPILLIADWLDIYKEHQHSQKSRLVTRSSV